MDAVGGLVVSRIEGEFLNLALELGLAETIAETLREIDQSIANYPPRRATRYLQRLHDQRQSLREPTLRTTAALVVSMCAKDPSLTPRIRLAYARLAEAHPDLAWFYGQLPADPAPKVQLRRAG